MTRRRACAVLGLALLLAAGGAGAAPVLPLVVAVISPGAIDAPMVVGLPPARPAG